MTSLDALANLTSLASLNLNYNPQLQSLEGLSSLTETTGDSSATGSVNVFGNASLTDLSGLDALSTVTGSFEVAYSDRTTLHGIQGLTDVGENFSMRNNHSLTTLAHVTGLVSVGGDLNVENNSILPTCWGEAIEGQAEVAGNVTIAGNDDAGACD